MTADQARGRTVGAKPGTEEAMEPNAVELTLDIKNIEIGLLRFNLTTANAEIVWLRDAKDTAYSERNKLIVALSCIWPAHLARHPDSDKEWEDDWRNIVCIHGPCGQMTWHIHDSEAHMFGHLNCAPDPFADCKWDGRDTQLKYCRLMDSAASHCTAAGEGGRDESA